MVNSTGSHAKVTLGNGNNTVNGSVQNLTVGNGDNTITDSATFAELKLGDGNNTVTLSGNMATVNVGYGRYDLDYCGSMGRLVFDESISSDRLRFKPEGQDLQISVTDSTEEVTLRNWYASIPERPSSIIAGDGKVLSQYNVEQLVQAMAAFAPPSAVTSSFTPTEQPVLQPLLAANWS